MPTILPTSWHPAITPSWAGSQVWRFFTYAMPLDVAFMIGHDDDVVLDPKVGGGRRRADTRCSRWKGLQSDAAIVSAICASYPALTTTTISTVEELIATDAPMVVILSYKTQPSFTWYSNFFDALRGLEARGTTVYPSCDFKQLISSKASYVRLLQASELPICPTEILDRAECVDETDALSPALVEARLSTSLRALQLLPAESAAPAPGGSALAPLRLVTKPSNADGGFGVAFWEAAATSPAAAVHGEENASLQRAAGTDGAMPAPCRAAEEEEEAFAVAEGAGGAPLVRSMKLRMLLNAGCNLPLPPSLGVAEPPVVAAAPSNKRQRRQAGASAPPPTASGGGGCARSADGANGDGNRGGNGGGGDRRGSDAGAFLEYLLAIGFVGNRPHVLLQPLVPQLAQHFEIKLYFLQRQPFYASLTYGKEQLQVSAALHRLRHRRLRQRRGRHRHRHRL